MIDNIRVEMFAMNRHFMRYGIVILVFLLASVGQFVELVCKSSQATCGLKCSCRRGHLPVLPRSGAQLGYRQLAKRSPPVPAGGVGELIPFADKDHPPRSATDTIDFHILAAKGDGLAGAELNASHSRILTTSDRGVVDLDQLLVNNRPTRNVTFDPYQCDGILR